RRLLVTAGGTREPVDPVRYLGNRSSGRMGNALAAEALGLGASVTLVTTLPPPSAHPRLDVVEVATAAEMLDAVRDALPAADGMGGEENAVTILGREGVVAEVTRAPKPAVARRVLEIIAARWEARTAG